MLRGISTLYNNFVVSDVFFIFLENIISEAGRQGMRMVVKADVSKLIGREFETLPCNANLVFRLKSVIKVEKGITRWIRVENPEVG